MAGLGVPELLIILVILLLVFGPKRLPQLGRQLGGGMREFKDSIQGKGGDDDDEEAAPASRAELSRTQQADVLEPTPDAARAAFGEQDERTSRSGG
jgi:sec-independent protein translocase protein TatA